MRNTFFTKFPRILERMETRSVCNMISVNNIKGNKEGSTLNKNKVMVRLAESKFSLEKQNKTVNTAKKQESLIILDSR